MLITKDLVILNLPKTGSSFVRKVVKDTYFRRRNKNIFTKALHKIGLRSIGFRDVMTDHPTTPDYQDQHGCYDQIPSGDKHKKILSVIRDPYHRLESYYKYRWWAKVPPIAHEQIAQFFPGFPEMTFEQYLQMTALESEKLKLKYGINEELKIGVQSIEFIRFYFKNHESVLSSLSEKYIQKGSFKKDLCEVTFLKTESLNRELALFLSQNGFSREEAAWVADHEKVNVTNTPANEPLVNRAAIDFINEYEWILFAILDSLGIHYRRD